MSRHQAQSVIGIDIGGTKLTAALADTAGAVGEMLRRRTEPGWTAQENLRALSGMTQELLDKARARGLVVAAIGVGFGGPVDPIAGVIHRSHHVPGWEGVGLKAWFEEQFGLPTIVDNDANAGGLGELYYGAARGRSDVLYVNIGTGIGGAVIIGGRLHHGVVGMAGEIGHCIVLPGGPVCTCGKQGCLEALCAGPGIARRAQQARRGQPDQPSVLRGRPAEEVTSEAVFAAAREGDVLAQGIVDDTARFLGIGIGNALNLINSEMVILGGGVGEVGDILLRPVREQVKEAALGRAAEAEVVSAQLGHDAGVMGAVALAAELLGAIGGQDASAH